MNYCYYLIALIVIKCNLSVINGRSSLSSIHLINSENWLNFKSLHNKNYENEETELKRYEIFLENLQKINYHNNLYKQGLVSYKKSINHFGDLTEDEFFEYVSKFQMDNYLYQQEKSLGQNNFFRNNVNGELPKTVDWRKKGIVTRVKNQGQCGSCWSFSATGSLEGQYAKKNGKLVEFSEQNLVDCSSNYGNEGCLGGLMDAAFEYIRDNGIETEVNYPYTGQSGECKFKKNKSLTTVSGFVDIIKDNETDLQYAIANNGPVSVAIQVTSNFQFYDEGVFHDTECTSEYLNHGVLAVGFNTTSSDKKYYLVKNSWGEHWGEKGYIRMSLDKHNNCGIATMASYPIL